MSDEHQRPQKDATADGTAGAEPEVDSPMHTALGGAPYNPPVASLLTIGDPHAEAVEASIAALSLGQEHVPELVRMAVDPALNNAPGNSHEVWAPLHALRALKRFDASVYVAELLPLVELDADDYFREELPEVFAQIGQLAVAPLRDYLTDRSHNEWGHSLVVRALGAIGAAHPALRTEMVALLSELLQNAEQYDELPCTFAMEALVELKAVEALPAIRHAFTLDKIDPMMCGSWGDILHQFGVEPEPDDPLVALSQQCADERRERIFPQHLRNQLNAVLGIAPESAFARLAHQRSTMGENPIASRAKEVVGEQAADKTLKERQHHAAAQARKTKQKRKAASAARKANRKQGK